MIHLLNIIQGKVIYKTVGDVDLMIHVFEPAVRMQKPASAIVFFFGGGWNNGTPEQFFEHCRYLASRGMVAFSAEYRIDGKSAVRWIRMRTSEYGIDPQRIAAAGGSAGGHVAACTAMIPGFEQPDEDMSVSSLPDALVLFNPVVDTCTARFADRFAGECDLFSPLRHIRAGLPPTIIFHGTADSTAPYQSVESFAASMRKAGNHCELIGFKSKGHGFFNYGRDEGSAYIETVRAADEFLASLGFLDGEPTI